MTSPSFCSLRQALLTAAAALVLAAGLSAADATKPAMTPPANSATPSMPGLKVGEKALDFTLKNADGKDVALAELLKKGNVALLFYRSGDWCPYCQAELRDLQKSLKDIEAAGVQLVGISYDSPETLKKVVAKFSLTFPVLSDAGSKTIDAWGLRNQSATGRAAGTPHPTIYLLDRQGVIRAKLAHEGYQIRPAPAEIIAAAKTLP